MNGHLCELSTNLSGKIAGLVRDAAGARRNLPAGPASACKRFERFSNKGAGGALRNRTIFGCAELWVWPWPISAQTDLASPDSRGTGNLPLLTEDLRYDLATQPQVRQWLEDQGTQAARYTQDEIGELLSMQGTGGPLTAEGLQAALRLLDRKRRLIERVHVIAGTEHLGLLEGIVDCLFERVQPYGNAG